MTGACRICKELISLPGGVPLDAPPELKARVLMAATFYHLMSAHLPSDLAKHQEAPVAVINNGMSLVGDFLAGLCIEVADPQWPEFLNKLHTEGVQQIAHAVWNPLSKSITLSQPEMLVTEG